MGIKEYQRQKLEDKKARKINEFQKWIMNEIDELTDSPDIANMYTEKQVYERVLENFNALRLNLLYKR